MASEETLSPSMLDKPLQFLTEDDISQLTREDCRRYLKDKGMRRPSWNKSQAIQQVISLKRLLETTPDLDKRKLSSTRPTNNPLPTPPSAEKSTSGDAEEPVSHRRRVLENSDCGSDSVPPRNVGVTNELQQNRNAGLINDSPGQLTIFYCGKVNVYDDVPLEKAQTIIQLAASPHQFSKEFLLEENTARRFTGNHSHPTNIKEILDSPTRILPTTQSGFVGDTSDGYRLQRQDSDTFREDNPADSSCSRKASVQRYLEKRKDRFKSKAKVTTPPSTNLDIYANNQIVDELPNRNDICSSPQIRPPNTPSRYARFWVRLSATSHVKHMWVLSHPKIASENVKIILKNFSDIKLDGDYIFILEFSMKESLCESLTW